MEANNIITIIGYALSGGLFAAFLTYKLGNRKQDQNEFTALIIEYKNLVESYKKEVNNLKIDFEKLKLDFSAKNEEIIGLRNQLIIFESSHSDIPIPIWLKDTSGKMLFVNREYEKELLNPINKTTADYIGFTDVEVWGEVLGGAFQKHDRQVMIKKIAIEFEETWTGAAGTIWKGKVIKYPRFLNRTVIGIGGIIVYKKLVTKTQDEKA